MEDTKQDIEASNPQVLKSSKISFYHLTTTPIERALPKLLERAYSGGYKICMVAESPERVEQFNQLLWTYDTDSFLPHGSESDPEPEHQPILLSTAINQQNHANLLVVTDGRRVEGNFERVLDMFDGKNPEATTAARTRWSEYKAAGHDISYFSQNEQGNWQKKS
jgi:DNA polymerase-3 subunit chi